MKIYNPIIHFLTAFIFIINGVFLFLPGMMVEFLSLIFRGNANGLFMMLGAAVFVGSGIVTIVIALMDISVYTNDPIHYRKFEILLDVIGIIISIAGLLMLLGFHQFSIQKVFQYDYEVFLFGFGALLAGNIIALVLILVRVEK